ncbi:MAG: energy transducer TonB [Bacteroidales bacterium]|nr:energy transducer TonB [Bacteroidales bacterium]
MKKLLGILVALFMFANVSFAQKQETFFGVKFGASEQEVIDDFKKHGLVINGKIFHESGDTLWLFIAEKKEYINYLKYDWNYVAVQFSDSKLGYIEFSRSFDKKDQAMNRYAEVASRKLAKKYEMVEVIRDTEDVIARLAAETEDLIVWFDCLRINYGYDYDVILHYVNKDIMFNPDKEVEELVIQTIQDELPPPPPDMDKYLDEDGNILPQYLDEDGNFIPQIEIEEVEEEEDTQTIFTVVEESAMFPGGQEELMKYISENLRYPQQAREAGTQGLVYVTFVVEKDGSLTDIRILRDLGNGCGEEAVRIVKTMPKWIPAKKRGKEVKMQYNLPVKFTLAG